GDAALVEVDADLRAAAGGGDGGGVEAGGADRLPVDVDGYLGAGVGDGDHVPGAVVEGVGGSDGVRVVAGVHGHAVGVLLHREGLIRRGGSPLDQRPARL